MTEKTPFFDESFFSDLEGSLEAKPQETPNKAKSFFHEDIFGKSESESLAQRKLIAEDPGNIPGLIPLWFSDIQRRKQGILNWNRRTVVQRVSSLVSSTGSDPRVLEITGEELLKHYPAPPKKVQRLIKALYKHPEHPESRLMLIYEVEHSTRGLMFIHDVKKSQRELPLQVYREFLLQAAVALEFYEFTPTGMRIALWSYGAYLRKLLEFSREQQTWLENKMKTSTAETPELDSHDTALKTLLQAVRLNVKMIEAYQTFFVENVNPEQTLQTTFSLTEILEFSTKKSNEKARNVLIFKALQVVNLLRFIPLLHPVAHEIAQKVIQLDPHNPEAYLIRARIYSSEIQIHVKRYEAGDRSAAARNQIKEAFKQAHRHYNLGIKKIGNQPAKKDKSILYEYASLIHYFYLICRDVILFLPPQQWFAPLLKSGNEALSQALTIEDVSMKEKTAYLRMQSKLTYCLTEEQEKHPESQPDPLGNASWDQLEAGLKRQL